MRLQRVGEVAAGSDGAAQLMQKPRHSGACAVFQQFECIVQRQAGVEKQRQIVQQNGDFALGDPRLGKQFLPREASTACIRFGGKRDIAKLGELRDGGIYRDSVQLSGRELLARVKCLVSKFGHQRLAVTRRTSSSDVWPASAARTPSSINVVIPCDLAQRSMSASGARLVISCRSSWLTSRTSNTARLPE